ncbi:class I SAM-dependent methyltransferase [Mucilaginibacter sp. AW1-3]
MHNTPTHQLGVSVNITVTAKAALPSRKIKSGQPYLKTRRIPFKLIFPISMAMLQTIKSFIRRNTTSIHEKGSVEAYNLWAGSYDDQPDNLMFYLDSRVFGEFMAGVDLKGKKVADIGCGTGRHWPLLYQHQAGDLTGYDVSEGMLQRLHIKFPDADLVKINRDDFLADVADGTYNFIISTLTIAHIENLEYALLEWCRILKPQGQIIITDFHPQALAQGGRRTFKHDHQLIGIRNHVHSTGALKKLFAEKGFTVITETERVIDESVKHFYEKQDALHVYNSFKGKPMIYGIHLKRE